MQNRERLRGEIRQGSCQNLNPTRCGDPQGRWSEIERKDVLRGFVLLKAERQPEARSNRVVYVLCNGPSSATPPDGNGKYRHRARLWATTGSYLVTAPTAQSGPRRGIVLSSFALICSDTRPRKFTFDGAEPTRLSRDRNFGEQHGQHQDYVRLCFTQRDGEREWKCVLLLLFSQPEHSFYQPLLQHRNLPRMVTLPCPRSNLVLHQ